MPILDLNEIQTRPPQRDGQKRYLFRRSVNGGSRDLDLCIDNSSLEVFATCPRAAMNKLVLSRERAPGAAINFGSCIHKELDQFYRKTETKPFCVFDRATVATRVIQFFADHPIKDDEWRNMDLMFDTIERYERNWQILDRSLDVLETERAFELPFDMHIELNMEMPFTKRTLLGEEDDGEPLFVECVHFYWTGRRDLAVRQRNGRIQGWDHKTTSMYGPTFSKDFEFNQQTVGYAWAMTQEYGEPVEDFLINVLAIRKPTKTGKGTEFDRIPYQYTTEMQLEWREDVMNLINDFIAHLARDYFPKATKWCVGKYGTCPYHSVCSLPRQQRSALLFSDEFSDVTWTPGGNDE